MVFRLPGVVEHYNFLISVRKGKVVGIDVGDSHGLAHVPQVIRQEGFPVVPHRVDEPYYVPGELQCSMTLSIFLCQGLNWTWS